MPVTKTKAQPGRRNSQYQKRLNSILNAAAKIIARDGFEGASVRDVAARAKVNLSNIYYYVPSKDALLFEIQRHTFSTLLDHLRQRLAACETPEQKLRAVIDNHLEFFTTHMDDLKVCVHEIESLSGKYYRDVLKIRREYYREVQQVIAELTGKSNHDSHLSALYLFGSLNWMYMWYNSQRNKDIRKMARKLMDIYLNGIRAA